MARGSRAAKGKPRQAGRDGRTAKAGRRTTAASSGDRRADVRQAASSGAEMASLEELVAAKEIVISCGSGGVGKTTTAAAIGAMAAAYHGGKVLVLTVDPARRLANALGLERFGNIEVQVPAKAFADAGVEPRGELYAAMLDTKQSWDDLIRRHAPDAKTRDALLANPLYNNVTGKFVQSHDYVAMERLYEIHASGAYDLIVVDTPPTRNAIDFLEAPERMTELFTGRLLRWLLAPYQSRMFSAASKPFYRVADRVLGAQVLEDLAEFFMLLQTMADGFIERAQSVSRTLADKRTTFLVVSTLEAAPVQEAEYFIGALAERRFHLGAVVLNKVLPDYLRDADGAQVARRLCDDHLAVAKTLLEDHAELGDVDDVARVLREVGGSYLNYGVVAKREAEQRAELARIPEVVATVPYFDTDIVDLGGLLRLGHAVWE